MSNNQLCLATMEDSTSYLIRLEEKVDKMVDALNKLVLVEERQSNQKQLIDRLQEEFDALKQECVETDKKVEKWINRGIGMWTVAGIIWTVLEFAANFKLFHLGP